ILVLSLVNNTVGTELKMDAETERAYRDLHAFMYEKVYLNEYAKNEEEKVPNLIEALYKHFLNPDHLTPELQLIAERDGIEMAACDFIAGMTDRYAIDYYEELFIPKSWNIGM
ncbi:MAG: deoxyguanosinetriphosphate triphosphohydrolase, partial [Oscillospiraceae bacterium]